MNAAVIEGVIGLAENVTVETASIQPGVVLSWNILNGWDVHALGDFHELLHALSMAADLALLFGVMLLAMAIGMPVFLAMATAAGAYWLVFPARLPLAIIELKDGKVHRWVDYWDAATIMKDLGITDLNAFSAG